MSRDAADGATVALVLAPEAATDELVTQTETSTRVPFAHRMIHALAIDRLTRPFSFAPAEQGGAAPADTPSAAKPAAPSPVKAPKAPTTKTSTAPSPTTAPDDPLRAKGGYAWKLAPFVYKRGDAVVVSVDGSGKVTMTTKRRTLVVAVLRPGGLVEDPQGKVVLAIDANGSVWVPRQAAAAGRIANDKLAFTGAIRRAPRATPRWARTPHPPAPICPARSESAPRPRSTTPCPVSGSASPRVPIFHSRSHSVARGDADHAGARPPVPNGAGDSHSMHHQRGTSDAALNRMKGEKLLESILELSPKIRYAALHLGGGEPLLRERQGVRGASADSERWEELVVNPVLIELASRRGDVDCDGLDYLLVRYRRFFNLVLPLDGGHLSVVLDPESDPLPLVSPIREVAQKFGSAFRRHPSR